MTHGDKLFLAAFVASNKRAISAECRRKNLDDSEYSRRAARIDWKALKIERSFSRPRIM